MRVLVAALLVLAAAIAVPEPAGATVVTYIPPYVDPPGTPPEESCARYSACPPGAARVQGDPGEANALRISYEGGSLLVRDESAPMRTSPGCELVAPGTVRCPAVPVSVDAADGHDRVLIDGEVGTRIDGGTGDDLLAGAVTLDGGPGADILVGTARADRLDGGEGADSVFAAAGDDHVADTESVPAADRLDGGEGIDHLVFTGRAQRLSARIGGDEQRAGAAGEGNVVAGFEALAGGDAGDTLVVDVGPVGRARFGPVLRGAGGNDRLRIVGGSVAGPSTRVEGGRGRDRLRGGPGRDVLLGGPGRDRLAGAGGDDLLATRDRVRDRADGGRGRDTVSADARDRTVRCERVRLPRARRTPR